MASITEPAPPPIKEAPRSEELLVDKQIQRTRRALKLVDLTSGIIALVIGVLAFLLTAAALEHWVIPGGWSSTARVILFAVFLLGVAWYSWRTFWPLLSQPINPAYAAQAIEQSSPTLKNSLLNFLLLRNRRRQISRQVYQAIEQQAAQRLSEVPLDSVVDRSAIIRLGYVLVAIVALCALYRVLSPKDMVASAARVLMPWSNVPVPSRVQINEIAPGDTSVARGEQLEVSAEVLGLKEDEPVRLRYSTADQQIVGQEIAMTTSASDTHFQCRVPGRMSLGDGGVQQDLTYWIEAGDARSQKYEVAVYARPTLVVQGVRYDYPDYTGYATREETNTGDISAVEGTVVTLTALANQPIEKAHVDFEADGRHDNLMKTEDRRATVSFPLELREDRRTPQHQSYVLRYTTTEGKQNQLPPKYQIEVTPDYSPEIRLLTPEEEIVDVAIDEQVAIEVEARDPDFAVRNVAVFGEVAGEQVLKKNLLAKDHTGRFVGRAQLTPRELGLKAGDVLEYWGAAADNREPEANLSFTAHRKIRVVGPGEGGGQGEGQQQNHQEGEGQQQSGEGGGEGDQSQSAEEGEGQGESSEGTDGETAQGQKGAGQESQGGSGEGQQQEGQGDSGEGSEQGQENQSDSGSGAGGDSASEQNNDSDPQDVAGEESSNSAGGEGGGNQEKVSPAGDDDGEAFERIANHFNEQAGDQQGGTSKQQPDSGKSGERSEKAENDSRAADGTRDSDQRGESADANEAEAVDDPEGAAGQQQDRSSEGPGAEGEQAPAREKNGEEQGEEEAQDQEAPGGEMSPEQGPAGAGDNPGENQGSPDVRGEKKPREKQSDQSADAQQNDQEAPAQGEGQTESDSKGSQGGDRSGGGQEGAGQQADAEGTGGAGENQAADEGGGQSTQRGAGETSSQPGGNKQADGETGESSQDQPGTGSKESEESGKQPGGTNQDGQGKNQNGAVPSDGQQTEAQQQAETDQQSNNDEASPQASGQQPTGGGTGGKSTPPPPGEIQPGDEANLEYARKQTELILDKLDDQLKKKEVDKGLLEKLGWNNDELRRFVDRWKNLKDQAAGESASADAQQELNEALRSLGLNRNRRTGFRAQTAKDKLRDLQDAYRGRTPLEYQDQVRAYVKGTATAEEK